MDTPARTPSRFLPLAQSSPVFEVDSPEPLGPDANTVRLSSRTDAQERQKMTEERIENQELFCHNCERYVQFPMDLSMNGNHVLRCPNCQHEHCRVVKNGKITGDRWDRRNGITLRISPNVVTSSSASSSNTISFSVWGTSAASGIYTITTSV